MFNGRRYERSSVVQHVERLQASPQGKGDITYNIPSLYVINTAALTKSHAVEQLAVDLRSYKIDIAVVTETHFKAKHSDSTVAVTDYTLLRRDRIGRKGGGVAAYVRCLLKPNIWKFSGDNPMFELLWITVDNLFVGVVYHPPRPRYNVESFLDYLEETVDEITNNFPAYEIVIAGDFNQLLDTELIQRTGLMQIVDKPTRGANTLDRVFVLSPMYTLSLIHISEPTRPY